MLGASAEASKLPPSTASRILSTRGAQPPHEPEALVSRLTSSLVKRPFFSMASTIIPLVTPLQPHTTASSGVSSTERVSLSAPAPLEAGAHEPEGNPPVLDALPDGIDGRVISLHGVRNDDALLAIYARGPGKPRVGPYAHGHDYNVGLHRAVVREPDPPCAPLAEDLAGLFPEEHAYAHRLAA